jgi:hypothetical protein
MSDTAETVQEELQMEETWMRFEQSGKVADYLSFKGLLASQVQTASSGSEKERPNGAECSSDRDGLKCNADWRV